MDREIKSTEDLKAWLQGKPVEWSQVIAARAALRVFPVVFTVLRLPDTQLDPVQKQGLILQAFRAVFISCGARKLEPDEVAAAAASAADAARAATRATDAAFRRATFAPRAAAVADATRAAARAAVFAADAAFRAAADAADAVRAAARAAAFVAAEGEMWAAVLDDCRSLDAGEGNLIFRPLWPVGVRSESKYRANLPLWAEQALDGFARTELARSTSFRLILDWYRTVAPDARSQQSCGLFGSTADNELIAQTATFWTTSNGRSAEHIMDSVAQIVRWVPSADEAFPIPPLGPASVRPLWKGNRVVQDQSVLSALSGSDIGLANLQSIREEMVKLSKSIFVENNIDHRPGVYISETAKLITKELPTSAELFRLVRREATLVEYETVVDEQWPDFLSRRYRAVLSDFSGALDQFEDRRRFARSNLEIDAEALPVEEISVETAAVVRQMRSTSGVVLIDESVPSTIEAIAGEEDEASLPDGSAVELVRNVDQLESINNTLKRLAEKADDDPAIRSLMRRMDEAYLSELEVGLVEGAREAGRNDGQIIAKSLMRAKVGASVAQVGAKKLTERYPRFFRWLKPYVDED